MTYALVMMLYSFPMYGGSTPLAVADFTSLERCEAAAKTIKNELQGRTTTLYYVCVQK